MKSMIRDFSWNQIEGSHRLMTLIVLSLGLYSLFWGERISAGNGLGFDGRVYASMTREIGSQIATGQLGSYYAQRILPSAIVHGMLRIAEAADNNENIIRCFELYNLLLVVGACRIWKRVADKLSLSVAGRWIGFGGLFLNFQCSKQTFFYPVLTDVTALFTGTLLLMFYLERKPIGLLVTTLIGAFAWPIVSVCGALLLVFLRSEFPKQVIAPATRLRLERTPTLAQLVKFGGGGALVFSAVGNLLLMHSSAEHTCKLPSILANGTDPSVVPCTLERMLTGLPSLAALTLALTLLIGSWAFFPAIIVGLRKTPIHLVVLAIFAVAVPSFVVKAISNPIVANPSNVRYLIEFMLLPPSGKILLPLVTLTAFWGPLVILLCLYWKECCVQARRLGPGVLGVLFISLPLGIACEPRFVTVAWPFFVLTLVLAFEHSKAIVPSRFALIALTVAYGQFWLPINIVPWPPDHDGLLEFPKQLYFMHYGPWMSWTSFLLQLPVILLSALWLYLSAARFKRGEEKLQPL
jgi:hypothetical protein